MDGGTAMSLLEMAGSFNCFVFGDHMLWLGRRRSTRLSWPGDRFGDTDVFFEEALADELFQVSSKVLTMDGSVPLAVMEGTILFCSGKFEVVMDRSRTSDPQLVLDSVEDLVNRKHEWGECFISLKVWSCNASISQVRDITTTYTCRVEILSYIR